MKFYAKLSRDRRADMLARSLIASLGLALAGSASINAQAPAKPWEYDGGEAEILNIIVRVSNGADRASTTNPKERDTMKSDGAIFYVPRYPYEDTQSLYRELSSSGDHMDSIQKNESSYTTEYELGRPYSNPAAAPGLTMITRGYDSSTKHHATMISNESPAGHTAEALNVYGWARYHNDSESMIKLSGGGVSVEANRVAGCAIWRWMWNGKQFLNNGFDFGREMQGDVAWKDSSNNTPNPTEAGDSYTRSTLPGSAKHGSPCVSGSVNGSTLSTSTVPLEFNEGSLTGQQGGPNNPVIWKDMLLGKDVTLNYENRGPVAEYVTKVTVPKAMSKVSIEIPTAFLTADFNRFYSYDAAGDQTSSVSVDFGGTKAYTPPSGSGGVIVATASGAYAMGIFGKTTKAGGSVSVFNVNNFTSRTSSDFGDSAANTTNLNAKYEGPIKAGTTSYRTWVVTGSLSDVKGQMKRLYQ